MTTPIFIRLAGRLFLVLSVAWLLDFFIVQNLPDEYFDVGKQVEIVIALALAWFYCMPLSKWGREATFE
jgi:hypothetical protein